MWTSIVLISALVCLAAASPALTTYRPTACLASEYTTCNRYQQCCASRCHGPHETSCSEENNRVRTASCTCKDFGATQTRVTIPPSTSHRDPNQTCRTRVGTNGSCDSFKQCCTTHCSPKGYSHYACASTGNHITSTTCTCQH